MTVREMRTRSFFLSTSRTFGKRISSFYPQVFCMSVHLFLLLLIAHVHVSPPLSLNLLRAAVGFLISSSEVSSSVSASGVQSRSSARGGSPYLPPSNSCPAVGRSGFISTPLRFLSDWFNCLSPSCENHKSPKCEAEKV